MSENRVGHAAISRSQTSSTAARAAFGTDAEFAETGAAGSRASGGHGGQLRSALSILVFCRRRGD